MMEGFLDGAPLTVAVTWLKDTTGAYVEVPLLDGQPFDFGLLAYTQNNGTTTRWFVPWSSVVYIKQDQVSQQAGPVATPPVPPAAPPSDSAG